MSENGFAFPFYVCRDPTEIINNKAKGIENYVLYMLDRVAQMFSVEGLPETIPDKWLKMYLLVNGYAVIAEHEGELYAYYGGLGGIPDTYYYPTIATVSNPYQNFSANFRIGEDCVIIPNDTLQRGIAPICERYAALLVETDISLRMSAINSRAMSFFRCGDENTAKRAQKVLDDLEAGKLGVQVGGDGDDWVSAITTLPMSTASSGAYITQLLEMRQYFWGMLWQELGVNTNHNMKREAINGNEAGLNDKALLPLVDDMFKNWTAGINMVNEKYGTSITVRKNSAWEVTEEEIETGTEEVDGSDRKEEAENERMEEGE